VSRFRREPPSSAPPHEIRHERNAGGLGRPHAPGVVQDLLAEVEFAGNSHCVIVSQGSRFDEYTMFVKGAALRLDFSALRPNSSSRARHRHRAGGVGVEFRKKRRRETSAAVRPRSTVSARMLLCSQGAQPCAPCLGRRVCGVRGVIVQAVAGRWFTVPAPTIPHRRNLSRA
jgi:hypothetical protein